VYDNITHDIVSKKAKPMDTDEEVEDDANPDDILPHLLPKKKNMPIASEGKLSFTYQPVYLNNHVS
jgi:hypothetical protein